MAGFTIKETIKRSQEQVFHVLANPGSVTFIENIRNTEKITDGPVGVGTRFRETRLINGKEEYGEMEIIQFEPNKVVSYASDTQAACFTIMFWMRLKAVRASNGPAL